MITTLIGYVVIAVLPITPAQKEGEFLEAIKRKDVAKVQAMLARGADPNAHEVLVTKPTLTDPGGKPEPGETALILAIHTRSLPLVKILLAKGAKVNLQASWGWTPLIAAAQVRSTPIAKFLLARGAKVNVANTNGDTALVFAANDGNNELIKALLEAGASINGGTSWTPLMSAAYNGFEGTVRLLLSKGANPNYHPAGLMTPLECSEVQSHEEIAAILRKAGGKGRSAAEIERLANALTDKWSKERKATTDAAKAQNPAEFRISENDLKVIDCVASDLANFKGQEFSLGGGTTLYLINETRGGANENWDGQMNNELSEVQAAAITSGMRQQWIRRSANSVSISNLKPTNKRVVLADPEKTRMSLRETFSTNSATKGWLKVDMPGYSKDRLSAFLRFSFGPTSHGASGTYLLFRKGNMWTVVWRDFAYYA